MITATDLTRRYGRFTAVDGVSFHIGRGEIVGLLGHNGAGKTTIMKVLTGYLAPSGGTAHIAGMDVTEQRREVQALTGYLPENCPLYPDMTVIDFLDLSAGLRGLDPERRGDLLRTALERTGLTERALQPIATLSRGSRQRVGVAQAILHQPQLLILDEPTNGLDPQQIGQMRALIRQLGETATVILSTHILQEVEAMCDRVLILNGGRLVLDSGLEELRRSRHLLLTTDLAPDAVRGCLAGIGALQHQAMEAEAKGDGNGDAYDYRLTLNEAGEPQARRQVAAAVARNLQEAGGRLCSLQPEQRSLESVFRELISQQGGHHAA
jgi:ABC-2 type transport system ATP-binding protein